MDGFILLRFLSNAFALLITVSYLYQMLYLFLPLVLKPKPHKKERLHSYAILIAARNEEAVLPHLLDSIRNQDYPAELIRVYVVADNCTDRTAQLAARGGATVYARFNREQVGKGYALNYLLQRISEEAGGLERFDAFLVFDADNLLQPDFITQINKTRSDGYEAFCGCRNSKNFGDNWLASSHALQFLHESTHLNRSRMLIGSCCMINGTGFGFTRQLLQQLGGWNFFTLSEDTEFSVRCMTRGVKIGYCHDAVFYDEQPTRFSQSWRQRTRWSQGTIQVSLKYAGQLFRGLFRGGRNAYACFETLTLSLWGYGAAGFSGLLSLTVTFCQLRWLGLFQALLSSVASTYLSLLLMGLLTFLAERHQIPGTPRQKCVAVLAFPIYMLSFVPIIITSLFRKFHWPPIEHTVAIAEIPQNRSES